MYLTNVTRTYSKMNTVYQELVGKTLSLVINDNNYILSYRTKENEVKKVIFTREEMFDATSTNWNSTLKLDSVYMKNIINCYIKNGILYLDNDIPFSTQMRELERLNFNFDYQKIHYDGELNFFDKLRYGKKILTSKDSTTEERKTTDVFASLKLRFTKLDDGFKKYIDDKIEGIYSSSKEKLASIDLTKPYAGVEKNSIYSQLIELSNKMPIFIEATNFLEGWKENDNRAIKKKIDELIEPYKTRQSFKMASERNEFINQVIENTIAEVEGREYIPREELARNFYIRQEKQCQLARDYYVNNKSTSDLAFNTEKDFELIIARIESIYDFYRMDNPYSSKMAECRKELIRYNGNQEESTKFEEYYQELLEILNESEKIAFNEIISSWKKHQNKTIYGANPILVLIGSVVELYNKYISRMINYKISENSKYYWEEEGIRESVESTYEDEYQSIIDTLKNQVQRKDTMIKTNPEQVYREALEKLKELTKRISQDLRHTQIKDGIEKISNGKMDKIVVDDSGFRVIYNKIIEAHKALEKLMFYYDDTSLFNHENIKESYNTSKREYFDIIGRVENYYTEDNENQEEYQSIIKSLVTFTSKVNTICENESKILAELASLDKQKIAL